MSLGVSKEEPGFVLSGVVHVAILLIGLLGLADAKKFDDAQESLAVEVITESQLKQITKGEKTAKEVLPDAKLRVDKVSDVKKQDEPETKKAEIAAPLPMPLPPMRPVEPTKTEPKKTEPVKAETAKAEPKEAVPQPPQKQVAVLSPPVPVALPPSRPQEPKKVETPKKVEIAREEEQDDKDAEIIRQSARKKAEQLKQEQVKAAEAKKLKEQKEAAEESKQDLAYKKELAQKQADQKRVADAKAAKDLAAKNLAAKEAKDAEEERKAEVTEKQEAAKKLADAKKTIDAKKAAEAQKISDAIDAADEAKAEKAERDAEAKAKAANNSNAVSDAKADAKRKELAAAKSAASDAEAKRQADFDKMMRSKLASNSQSSSSGSNGKQTPTDKTSGTTGSTGRELSTSPSSLGSPTASGPKMNPALREGLQDIIKDQMLKCWSAGSKPSTLPLIRIQLNADGTLQGKPQLVNSSSDPVFNSVAESGMRAIRSCAPYKIPSTYAGFFNDWKTSTIKLDPSDL